MVQQLVQDEVELWEVPALDFNMVQQFVQDEVAPMVWFNKCNPDDADFPDVHNRLALLASLQTQLEPRSLQIS